MCLTVLGQIEMTNADQVAREGCANFGGGGWRLNLAFVLESSR